MKAPIRALGVHSSGRFDRSNEALSRSVHRLRRVTRGVGVSRCRVAYVTGTEGSGRSDAEMQKILGSDPDWAYVHLPGAAAGECWATWRTDHLELDGLPFARKLTTMTWVRAAEFGGKQAPPVTALVIPLRPVGRPMRRSIYLIVVHMPLDNTDQRAAVWLDVCRGLRRFVTDIHARDPHAEVAIEADWNKDYRNESERALIEKHVARPLRLVQGWDGSTPAFKNGGTHGRRLIDGVVASRRLLGWSTPWCWLAADDDSSDHRPYVHTLRWPLLPKRVRQNISKTARP